MHNICVCQSELGGEKKKQKEEIDSIVVSRRVNEQSRRLRPAGVMKLTGKIL